MLLYCATAAIAGASSTSSWSSSGSCLHLSECFWVSKDGLEISDLLHLVINSNSDSSNFLEGVSNHVWS